jgi:adenylate cyclase
MECGAPLGRSCPSCGAGAQHQARFCVACGTHLDAIGPGPAQAPVRAEERRIVTIVFADIVGYTTISEQLDHESVKAVTDRCLKRLALEVERFGGYVDQYIGDNVMAVFGAPRAHENDAERGVRAAAGMHAAMGDLNRTLRGDFDLELALRIGVNTGEVLAGLIGSEYTVVGDAVNVASRLQGAAEPGRTLVGDRTRRSTAAAVAYRQVGPLTLKGKEKPVSAWEVVSVAEPRARPGRPLARAPLIGRERELTRLAELYEHVAADGASHLLTLVGDAGVGKTRLVDALERRLARRLPRAHILHGRSLGFGSEAAFGPLAQMLGEQSQTTPGDSAAEVREKLVATLTPLLPSATTSEGAEQRLAPLLRLLDAGPADEEAKGAELASEAARENFFATVRTMLEALAADRVPVLIWDDAQWADEGMLDLVEYLANWLEGPVLQVCVGRDDLLARRPQWATERRRRTCMVLQPLAGSDARELIDALLGTEGGATVAERSVLAERTGGNPLFAEALVDSIAVDEAGHAELPDTVKGLLSVRLDALSPFERDLLGHASVVGLTFSAASLEPLADDPRADLGAALETLREKHLIRPVGTGGDFAFEHMLVREAAYERLPKAVRARKHVEVAAALEARPVRSGAGSAFALAEHHARAAVLAAEVRLPADELARMRNSALEHGVAAGDQAASVFSNHEALERYRSAATFAEPADPALFDISERCGEIEMRLGNIAVAIEAWERCLGHHREGESIERAAETHRKIAAALVLDGDRDAAVKHLQRGINLVRDRPASPPLARLFGEAASLYMQVGANMLAAYTAGRALSFAEQLEDARSASRAHTIYGGVFGRIGDAAGARQSLERAVELVRESDPEEAALAMLAAGRTLDHCLGDYVGARDRYADALELAEQTGDVPLQIELRAALGGLALRRCEWAQAGAEADCAAQLAEAHGLESKLCLADALRGRLRWRSGDLDGAMTLLVRARAAMSRHGRAETTAEALIALAAALRDRGELGDADATLREALSVCERAGLGALGAEACAALALVCVESDREEEAREVVSRAQALTAGAHDPVSHAASLEAAGLVGDPADLDLARAQWTALARPLDAARCLAESSLRLRELDPEQARDRAAEAAEQLERLEVPHLADRARELAGS